MIILCLYSIIIGFSKLQYVPFRDRFCVSVFRDNFPAEYNPNTSMLKQGSLFVQPGHLITIVAPVRIVNLLPLDLKYTVKSTAITGVVKPGKIATLHSVCIHWWFIVLL